MKRNLFFTFLLISILPSFYFTTLMAMENNTTQSKVNLTQEEKNYIQSLGTLKVPFIADQPPLTFKDEGKVSGYLNDLFKIVANKLELKYEYIEYSFANSIQALKDNKVDLLTDYSLYGEKPSYLLHTKPVLSSLFVAVGHRESTMIHSIGDLNNKRLVMVSGFQQTQTITKRYPNINIILVNSIDKAYRLLRSNKADYYIDNAIHAGFYLYHYMISDLKIVGELSFEEMGQLNFYFALNDKHPLLYSAVQKVLDTLDEKTIQELRSKWLYQGGSVPSLYLNEEEKKWLQEHPLIKVVSDPDWAPIESRDANGDYNGIAMDYLKLLEKKLGVKLMVENKPTWLSFMKTFNEKRADILSSVAKTPSREKIMDFTLPYINIPIHMFTQKDSSEIKDLSSLVGKRVAVVDGYAIEAWVRNDYPQIDVVEASTPAKGLLMLQDGEVDVYLGNILTTNYYISKMKLITLKDSGGTEYSNKQSIGVRKDWPTLLSVLNKGLVSISNKEHSDIYKRWSEVKFEHSTNYTYVFQITGAALALLLIIIYWNRKLKILVNQQTKNLIENEENTKLILESTAEGIFGVDKNGDITFVNHAASHMLGFLPEELIGSNIRINIQRANIENTENDFSNCKISGFNINDKELHLDNEAFWKKDGTPIPVEYRCKHNI